MWSLDRYAFGEISWLIHICALDERGVVGERIRVGRVVGSHAPNFPPGWGAVERGDTCRSVGDSPTAAPDEPETSRNVHERSRDVLGCEASKKTMCLDALDARMCAWTFMTQRR